MSQYSSLTPVFAAAWPYGLSVLANETEDKQREMLKTLIEDSNQILNFIVENAEYYNKNRNAFFDRVSTMLDQGPVEDLSFRTNGEDVGLLVKSINEGSQTLFDEYVTDEDLDTNFPFLQYTDIFIDGENQLEIRALFKRNDMSSTIEALFNIGKLLSGSLPISADIEYKFDDYKTYCRWVLFVHRLSIVLGAMFDLATFYFNMVMDDDDRTPKEDQSIESELMDILEDNSEINFDDDFDDDELDDYTLEGHVDAKRNVFVADGKTAKSSVDQYINHLNKQKEASGKNIGPGKVNSTDMTLNGSTQKKDAKASAEFDQNSEGIDMKMRKIGQKAKLLLNTLTGKQGFYKKIMGRIDGLYDQYGDATIRENKMLGDPTTILTGTAKKYVEELATKSSKIYAELMNLVKGLAQASDPDSQLALIAKYTKIPFKNMKNAKDEIYRAFFTRIAQAIMGNVQVYGFTMDSIVANRKVPPPNHVIVSLFVANAHEEPKEMSVREVFESVESFKLMDNVQKMPIYDIVNKASSAIQNAGSAHEFKEFTEARKLAIQKIKGFKSGSSFDDAHIEKKKERQLENAWKGLEHSLQKFLTMKNYIIQCCDSYMNMVDRVDALARQCIGAMLQKEKEATDAGYKSGPKAISSGKIAKLSQNPNYEKKQAATGREKVMGAVGGMIHNRSIGKSARRSGVEDVVARPIDNKNNAGKRAQTNEEKQAFRDKLQEAKKRLALNKRTR